MYRYTSNACIGEFASSGLKRDELPTYHNEPIRMYRSRFLRVPFVASTYFTVRFTHFSLFILDICR